MRSTNTPTLNRNSEFVKRGDSVIVGENITSAPAGYDDINSGLAPGDLEAGGIQHFANLP